MSSIPRPSTDTPLDLLVVGGGIHGLFAAFEAASRGWTVTLIERDDFGSGLSFNHQRTVHGGLRTLQSGRVDKARQQIDERRAWALMAPHLIRPLPFLLPTGTGLRRSRTVLGAGLRLYDWLGRHRNAGLPKALHLPDSRIASVEEATRLFPEIAGDGLTGGAVWHDYQVRHPDRLNWLVALAAERAGARLLNHTEAIDLLKEDSRVVGVRARDVLTGHTFDISARSTLLCAGGAISALHAAWELRGAPLLVRASNLLVNRPALELALAAPGASGRMLTATPWSGHWLIGTFQSPSPVDAADAWPPLDHIDAMIDDANSAFPSLQLRRQDVLLIHNGVTPAVASHGRVELMPEAVSIDHAHHGKPGVFTLIGVKFTTARLAASDALRAIERAGVVPQKSSAQSRTPSLLPHGSSDDALSALRAALMESNLRLDDDVETHLVDWYATEAADVVRVSAAAGRTKRLASDSPILDGEILYAIERSKARRLADAVLRRTRLGAAGHPGRTALEAAADVMADRLGWSTETRQKEIARVEARYQIG